MRAHSFRPAFDFLDARITLSDVTPISSASSTSVLVLKDGNSGSDTDIGLLPGSEGNCTGVEFVTGDQTTINVNDPSSTTISFVP